MLIPSNERGVRAGAGGTLNDVADRLVIDLDAAGLPLGPEELEELRWYLEDYLLVPFGVYEGRGARIAEQLPVWGRALFSALLASGAGREDYLKIRAKSSNGPAWNELTTDGPASRSAELVLQSSDPARLALPWELLLDPDPDPDSPPTPLALGGVSLSRALSVPQSQALEVAGSRLRVLMVICRPGGARDVGYRMIARPLLQRLEAVRGRVEIEVLRPPTLAGLAARLRAAQEAGEPFQIVHFDGHGTYQREGTLVFEKPDGGADTVPAGKIARILAETRVPVVVLNACQSGAVGKTVEAAVATRLLAGGTSAVVAMAYRVYAVAAAEFMTAFYESLFAGSTVGEAVSAGRRQMARNPNRPSPKGKLPLADWSVPVHYCDRTVRFPQLRPSAPEASKNPELAPATERDPATEPTPATERDPLDPVEEFVGRDELFHRLETAARTDRVIVLHGLAGSGKTEAAKAFGRWWRDTGGVDHPEAVVWHSFEPGVASFGLDGVVAEIGTRLLGPDFAVQSPDARREQVRRLLRTRRLLLIWDNFESVASMPDADTAGGPLSAEGRAELARFLADVAAGGSSTALITSRTPETWLGPQTRRIEVGGLARDEAIEYADRLLAPYPAAGARRAERAFAELLEWLDGHPLTMRLTLPHLESVDADVLLARLSGASPSLSTNTDTANGRRTASLAASIAYSLDQLSPADRRLLAAVSLPHGVVDVAILVVFSGHTEVPARFRGADIQRWKSALEAAAYGGLLTSLGEGRYGIHPALPASLADRWRAEDPEAYPAERAAAERVLLDCYCAYVVMLVQESDMNQDGVTYAFTDLHRRTLGHLLGYALDAGLWMRAWPLLGFLNSYLKRKGLFVEAERWSERVRLATVGPDGSAPQADTPAGMLWRTAVETAAQRHSEAGDVDAAEAAYQAILAQPGLGPGIADYPQLVAIVYDGLGTIAQHRGRYDEAARWHRRALDMSREADTGRRTPQALRKLGNLAEDQGRWDEAERHYRQSLAIATDQNRQHSIALAYDSLGDLAEKRGQLSEAEKWHYKSLAAAEERHDRAAVVRVLGSLGNVAGKRGDLDAAERLYHRALTAAEEVGDRRTMAEAYHYLGVVALQRRQEESEEWHTKSLALREELGDRHGKALSLLQLSMVAIGKQRPDEAERLCHEALDLMTELGNREGMALAYHLLGGFARGKEEWEIAEGWFLQAVSIDEEIGHLVALGQGCNQLSEMNEARGRMAEALRWMVRSVHVLQQYPHLARNVEHRARLARLTGRLGMPELEACWSDTVGEPLPRAIRKDVEAHTEYQHPVPPEGR